MGRISLLSSNLPDRNIQNAIHFSNLALQLCEAALLGLQLAVGFGFPRPCLRFTRRRLLDLILEHLNPPLQFTALIRRSSRIGEATFSLLESHTQVGSFPFDSGNLLTSFLQILGYLLGSSLLRLELKYRDLRSGAKQRVALDRQTEPLHFGQQCR